MERELLTPEEAAYILKLSKYTIYEMVKRGELPAIKVGRKVRIERSDIDALIHSSRVKVEQEPVKEQINREGIVYEADNTILFMGSHDISLDYVIDFINHNFSAKRIVPAYIGSMEGLLNLYWGKADIAGCHLFDEETGEYNTSFVKRIFSGEKVYILRFVKRNLGWIVAQGNPKKIENWQDLTRTDLTLINRQKGAGTRILLDYQLKRLGISKEQIKGYNQIERTHYGTAAAVARGDADLALGTESAARSIGMDFITLTKERYDFVTRPDFIEGDIWSSLQRALRSPELREKIKALGGYDVENMGEIIEEVF